MACSSSGGDGDDSPPPDDPVAAPTAATLVFPENNTECTEGNVISETRSSVTFRWNAAQNADSYELNVINLNTSVASRTTTANNEASFSINRGTPYEWFVVSRANGTTETATSSTFRFFNEGPGIENYAPFPAEAVNPARGANLASTATVTLEWSASDVDDDIEQYEVFFGTEANPTNSLGTTTDTSIADVAVTSGNTYYWTVTTTDSQGNTSTSEVFQFRVN
ncbi:hypothetical protein [Allomuricauda sp. SCSIO 65647]|uniref:hypothetical protein n=1 Tax=Allomuricauda sp. SCSIO 65647 TaxID=2908843 RepID=UPI001F490181|nr:hypothetical protein [Muricauda sp. SCSIO 65647]UJH66478.1 hypothetical protein L0P89_10910 [Muricauda sp. SCSIO 65647]